MGLIEGLRQDMADEIAARTRLLDYVASSGIMLGHLYDITIRIDGPHRAGFTTYRNAVFDGAPDGRHLSFHYPYAGRSWSTTRRLIDPAVVVDLLHMGADKS